MSYENPIIRSVTGNVVKVSLPATPDQPVTYLSSSILASATALTVADNNGFSQNDFALIGQLGVDTTEIQRITGAVSAGTSLTTNATTFPHPVDVLVAKILWDQIEFSGATTITGTKTVIATTNIQPDRPDTTYVVSGTTYAFYFARFKNSFTSTFSPYSIGVPAGGYSTNQIRYVKDEALAMTGEKISTTITDNFLNQEIFNCEQEVFSEKKRWSWAYTFDKILGNTVEGGYSIALPTDIGDPNSNKSVLNVHIWDREAIDYIDEEEWLRQFVYTRHTTIANNVTIGDTTITLADSSNFDASGGIVIGSDSAINYTSNTISTGVLGGVTGIVANHTAGQDVWQNATFAEPTYFTIRSGSLYFNCPVQSLYATKNIYLSYYRKPTAIANDNDTLNLPDYTVYHYYLAYKIALKKNNGIPNESSTDFYAKYQLRKEILKKQDRVGQYVFMKPRLNVVSQSYQTRIRTSFTRMEN